MEAHGQRALPEGWEWKRLGEVATVGAGNSAPQGDHYFNDGKYPFVRTQDVGREKAAIFLVKTKDEINDLAVKDFNLKLWPVKTLLIPKSGESTFLNHRALLGKPSYVSSHLATVVPSNRLLPEYLFFWSLILDSKKLTHDINYPSLRLSELESARIPLPPLTTQRRIVSILEKAEGTKRLRAQADELTDRLLQSVFLEMFGDPVKNPKGWEMIKLGELTEISSGSTPSRDVPAYFGGEIPWVKTTEVKGIRIHNTEEYITMSGLNNSSCKIYPKKSIIIAMYGQGKTRGNVGLLEIDAATNQACCVLKPNQKYDSVYLFELLRNSYDNLRNLGRGGNQPNLNGEIIKNYVIPLPPLPIQQQFARLVEKVEAMRQSQAQSKQQIEDLFSALVQKAFRGEI
ncbi:MAG: hypothetical protein FIB07_03455 [Candidatus Methanoperedens sp.]|nr:hypothetical protein [Candidatus Methanoperedens sp.]